MVPGCWGRSRSESESVASCGGCRIKVYVELGVSGVAATQQVITTVSG